ncbi:MAG: spondin domain-containing protein [Pseudomonadota bacterium]
MHNTRTRQSLPIALLGIALAACGGGNNIESIAPDVSTPAPPPDARFEVTVTNLTNAQPLSPVAIIAHRGEYQAFTIGEAVTVGMESLAEGGDNGDLIAEAESTAGVLAAASGVAPIGPGGSETVEISVNPGTTDALRLSLATMLVNTNDAISGAPDIDVGGMAVGEQARHFAIAYDAGTEANTEAAGTIPGPAVGGEGFNAARDDIADRVSMHPGVISNETGLATSVLSAQQRFDNPVLSFTVTRLE